MEDGIIRTVLKKLDEIPPLALLMVDAGLGLFVFVAHAGALALTVAGVDAAFARFVPALIVSVFLAFLVMISSVAALIVERWRVRVLRVHAVLLGVGAAGLLIWGIKLVVAGIPQDPEGGFAWTPGLFTLIVFYCTYLMRRAWLLPWQPRSVTVRHRYLWVAALAFAIELGVIARPAGHMHEVLGGFGSGF